MVPRTLPGVSQQHHQVWIKHNAMACHGPIPGEIDLLIWADHSSCEPLEAQIRMGPQKGSPLPPLVFAVGCKNQITCHYLAHADPFLIYTFHFYSVFISEYPEPWSFTVLGEKIGKQQETITIIVLFCSELFAGCYLLADVSNVEEIEWLGRWPFVAGSAMVTQEHDVFWSLQRHFSTHYLKPISTDSKR